MSSGSARRLVLFALGLGVAGDALLRPVPPGLGAALWVAAIAAMAIALQREAPRIPLLFVGVFGLALAWRDSAILQALFACAALVAASTAFLDRPARAGVTAHAVAAIAALTSAVVGPALLLGRAGVGGVPRARWRVGLVGALAAAPLLLVFGSLFASADPLFAKYAGDLARSLDDAVDHGLTALAIAWLAGGVLAGLAFARAPSDLELGRPPGWVADAVAVPLALVVAIFAAFLAVQARALVGGHGFVEATLGLGYADYARRGFFQLLACAGLALPLLLTADAATAPGDARRGRNLALSLVLVALVLTVLVSAARRMSLYVDAYGLSELRLYASAIMAWLGLAVAAFAIDALRGSRRGFVLGALAAGAALVVGLGALNPQAAIVRVNAGRARSSVAGFDAAYATTLGADAVPALLDVLSSLPPRPRCAVARDLAARAAAPEAGDWRSLDLSRRRARARLAASRDELAAFVLACPSLSYAPRRG